MEEVGLGGQAGTWFWKLPQEPDQLTPYLAQEIPHPLSPSPQASSPSCCCHDPSEPLMPLKLLGHLAQPLTCWSEKEWPSRTSPKTLPTFLSPGQGSTFLRESLSCSNASCRWFLGNLCSKSSLIWGTAPREPAANLSLHSMNAGGEYDFFFF